MADSTGPSDDDVRAIIAEHRSKRGALLPMLHGIQQRFGYVDQRAIPVLADELNLSEAEVYGVVTFYRDFSLVPAAGPIVRVCRAEACQARGGEALAQHANAQAISNGTVVQDVFCLGNCALGPSVVINGQLFGQVNSARFDELVAAKGSNPAPTARAIATPGAVRIYVPGDSAARAVGADEVVAAINAEAAARRVDVDIVRNGSRGMLWLEPLVEVATANGRVAYGPIRAADVASLFAAGFAAGFTAGSASEQSAVQHPLALGLADELPWWKAQQRITFARVGAVDPYSAEDFEAHGGLAGLRRALTMTPTEVIAELVSSGLRGRGGAGFPAGIKWQTVANAVGPLKFVCANADEGDSGTFADRMLMEGDPFSLIEGMVIAAWAVGATEGFIYIRSEYPDAIATLQAAVDAAYARGWLGPRILASDLTFDLQLRVGAGAYICGEETAMLESLEGRRGVVRAKPPLPAIQGLFGKPTVVNNVLTLATVPAILAIGAAAYSSLGIGRSRGTQVYQLAGNVRFGGAFEAPFGLTLGALVEQIGGGTNTGKPVRAVQVGGPLGSYLPPAQFDLPFDYEAFSAANALVGHGGIVVFDDSVDMARQARFAMSFCAEESCGKCTPCRIGAVRGVEVIDRILSGQDRSQNLELLADLCEVMADGSLCAMGGLTPLPVRSALAHFAEDFQQEVPT